MYERAASRVQLDSMLGNNSIISSSAVTADGKQNLAPSTIYTTNTSQASYTNAASLIDRD